ncbi:hypothetical protein E8E11_003594 [Didymella keratinophila]|nr:hypothetical protein E8E11_003594 [Didymella keratinophila]
MPAFTLYGARGSTNTNRVRLTLIEGGFTDYKLVLLDLYEGEQKSEENVKRHPWGKVPAIVFPNGFTLHESRVISTYLARKYDLPLVPSASDFEVTAQFEQAQAIETTYFAEPASRLAFEKFVKKRLQLPPNEAAVTEALKSLKVFFDVAEQTLQQQEHMAGDECTLVDIFYIPLIQRLFVMGHGDLVTSREAVNGWWARCISRPAVSEMFEGDRTDGAADGR